MGVCFLAHAITPANLARVLADPPLVWRVLEPDDDHDYRKQRAAVHRPTLWQRLLGRHPAPVVTEAVDSTLLLQGPELNVLDLDKAWDGLRTCVQHCAPHAPDFFEGDGQIGHFDVGYSPAQFATSDTLAAYATALAGIDTAQLLRALRSADFKGVYLGDVWQRADADAEAYLTEHFQALLSFTQHCSAHRLAAVLRFT